MGNKRLTKKDTFEILNDFESCLRANLEDVVRNTTSKDILITGPEVLWITAQLSAISAIKFNLEEFEKEVSA
jgi:hypothetical protein